MEFPLYGNHQPHKHGKKVEEANRTIVPNVDKLALKPLTLYTVVDKLSQKKYPWFYKLMSRAVA